MQGVNLQICKYWGFDWDSEDMRNLNNNNNADKTETLASAAYIGYIMLSLCVKPELTKPVVAQRAETAYPSETFESYSSFK